MSDDFSFGDDELDASAFMAGLDDLKQQQQVPKPAPVPAPASHPVFRPPSRPALVPNTSRFKFPAAEVIATFDDSFDLESTNCEEFDQRDGTHTPRIHNPVRQIGYTMYGRTDRLLMQRVVTWQSTSRQTLQHRRGFPLARP
jgi:hypothetical protein